MPLLIHYPPLFPAGKVTEGTEAIDIVPTLADALGVATDPEWQGMSLIPVANGARRLSADVVLVAVRERRTPAASATGRSS